MFSNIFFSDHLEILISELWVGMEGEKNSFLNV